MAETLLQIEDLKVSVDGKPILKGVTLAVKAGEVHAIMGPNGSGKSTLANVLLGHPKYEVTGGRILYRGEDITSAKTYERARKGMFLAFQYPISIPGVSVANFLRTAIKAIKGEGEALKTFRKTVKEKMKQLGMEETFANRYVNDGFSGGEKKRLEILQMAVLDPRLAVLDETDSGLDIDALKIVSDGVNRLATPENGILLITHYQRMLDYVKPHFVHVFVDGRIVKQGGPELAKELELKGYDPVIQSLTVGA